MGLMFFGTVSWAGYYDFPDCDSLRKDSQTAYELCRVYRDGESCLMITDTLERATCEAFRDRQCITYKSSSLSAPDVRSYGFCQVYLKNESCDLHLTGFDLEVCQAHREGLCDRYTGYERRKCDRKYALGNLVIHSSTHMTLYYNLDRRWPYLVLHDFDDLYMRSLEEERWLLHHEF